MTSARAATRVVIAGPPLDDSGGIGRVMGYLLGGLAPEDAPVAVLDTRGRSKSPVFSLLPVIGVARRLRQLNRDAAIDLVHINISSHGSTFRKVILATCLRRWGVPYVFHLHASRFVQFYAGLPAIAKRRIGRGFREAATVIVLGEVWRDYVIEVMDVDPSRIVILPNAVPEPDAESHSRRDNSAPLEVLFLGRLGERKGSPDLLAALAALPPRVQWHATLAGDGDIAGHRRIGEQLGIADRVSLPGWVPEAEAAALLAQAHVLALPSRAEGLPMSVLEALSYGIPVIATAAGALGEVLSDGVDALIVEPGDIQAITSALTRLSDDEPLRRQIGKAARENWRTHFSLDSYVERMRDVWDGAARAGRAGRAGAPAPLTQASGRQ